MAYPAFYVAPFIYRFNFHSQDTRNHIGPNSVRIVADTDVHAAAFATLLHTYMDGQLTSTSKRMGQHNANVVHPTGTRLSANVLIQQSNGATQRYHLRNLKTTLVNPVSALANLFLGTLDAADNVAALSAPANLPNGGGVVTVVNATVITKH